MDHFDYRDGRLCAEDVPLADIAAQFGTPCYVYSRATIERHWHAFDDTLRDRDHLICYAVKANSNLAVLNLMARLGSGFDIVSGGELQRVLAAGGDARRVVFSGVGKSRDDIRGALQAGILCFNVESEAELERVDAVAGELGMKARVSLRVNPDVDAGTHPYISTGLKDNKFGIDISRAPEVYARAMALAHVTVTGVDCHIGSQITTTAPYTDALSRVLELVDGLVEQGIAIQHVDFGGGFGIRYRDESPPSPTEFANVIDQLMGERLHKNFAVVDAAMNDMLRPALYDAYLEILPVEPRSGEQRRYDVVGPICESGDFLGKDRDLNLRPDDLLALRSAGAYGFSMSSNYNTRPRAAEVMVDGGVMHLVRQRETVEQLLEGESVLPE